MYVDISRFDAKDVFARADAALALGFVTPIRRRPASKPVGASRSSEPARAREHSGVPSLGTVRHECGHALEVLLAGGTVSSIECGADGGVVYYSGVPSHKKVYVLLAGAVAENPQYAMASDSARDDRRDLLAALRHVLPNRTDAERLDYAYSFWEAVDDDISVNIGFFNNLVALVSDRHYVSGADVHALWTSHQRDRQRGHSYY